MNKPNPTAAFLVIGDEILSGRTKDANINFLATELVAIGIDLKEVRIVPVIPANFFHQHFILPSNKMTRGIEGPLPPWFLFL